MTVEHQLTQRPKEMRCNLRALRWVCHECKCELEREKTLPRATASTSVIPTAYELALALTRRNSWGVK